MSWWKSFDRSREAWLYQNEKLNAVFAWISAGERQLCVMCRKIKIRWSPPCQEETLWGNADGCSSEWKQLNNLCYHASAFWFIDSVVDGQNRSQAVCSEFNLGKSFLCVPVMCLFPTELWDWYSIHCSWGQDETHFSSATASNSGRPVQKRTWLLRNYYIICQEMSIDSNREWQESWVVWWWWWGLKGNSASTSKKGKEMLMVLVLVV